MQFATVTDVALGMTDMLALIVRLKAFCKLLIQIMPLLQEYEVLSIYCLTFLKTPHILTRYWWMQGSRTTSVRVKYSPSANTCSRGGRSVVFTFLISEFSLVVKVGTEVTDSLARAALSSSPSHAWGPSWGSEVFVPKTEALLSCCLCSWSFCLRILSSLWTLTGSASLRSSVRMESGSCWCWLVRFCRYSSTADGMLISHSLVHLLTWEQIKQWESFYLTKSLPLLADLIWWCLNCSGFQATSWNENFS